jgi:hypothetical protein
MLPEAVGSRFMKMENPILILAALTPIEMPIRLNHFDSDFCWCDPLIETDENGQETIIHQQVTWN